MQVNITNSQLGQLNAERIARAAQAAAQASTSGAASSTAAPLQTISLLTYNVWCVVHLCWSLHSLFVQAVPWDVQFTECSNTSSVLGACGRFMEEIALKERMGAIGGIVVQKGYPTILCFQACPCGKAAVCDTMLCTAIFITSVIPSLSENFDLPWTWQAG